MARVYLQHMVEDIPDSSLPQAWVDHDLAFFSSAKRLYDYQQQAMRNALKALWKYYEHFGDYQQGETDDANRQRKQRLCQWYQTLSNLTGKWIRRIYPDPNDRRVPVAVEFADGERVELRSLDWRRIKPLIWW